MILLWVVKEARLDIPVYFINTGYHFEETISFLEKIQDQFGIRIRQVHPMPRKDTDSDRPLYESNPDRCCWMNKVEPFMRIRKQWRFWIHALRQDQSPSRSGLGFFSEGEEGAVKLYPLADWTREECMNFIAARNIPIHPLHAQWYPSIGCAPCTRSILPGEDERAGRWSEFPHKTECGLHQNISQNEK